MTSTRVPASGRRTWSTEERRALYDRPSPLRPIVQGSANLALYAGAAYLSVAGPAWVLIMSWPFMGLILAGFLAAGHECLHNSFAKSKRANRLAGMFWCTLVLNNVSAIRFAHMVHHRFTRVEGDSETQLSVSSVRQYIGIFLSPTTLARSTFKALAPLWQSYPVHAVSSPQRRQTRIDSLIIACWLLIALVLTVWAPLDLLCVYWGPMLFFFPMVIAIAIPEHYACAAGPDALPATRTTATNPLVRMLIWNTNYHTEHHLYPSVPCYNLPRLHRAIRSELHNVSKSYIAFHGTVLVDLARSPRAPNATEPRNV